MMGYGSNDDYPPTADEERKWKNVALRDLRAWRRWAALLAKRLRILIPKKPTDREVMTAIDSKTPRK